MQTLRFMIAIKHFLFFYYLKKRYLLLKVISPIHILDILDGLKTGVSSVLLSSALSNPISLSISFTY